MTALSEYQRLECIGLWRPAAQAQRREVVVSFGDATLMMSDVRSQQPLTHWSLPATLRRNPGEMPAIYGPDTDTGEELEISDETMIGAIAKIHGIIAARRSHPGRLRRAVLVSGLVVVAAIGVTVLPKGIVEHTATALPAARRADIGAAILADLGRLTGQPCASPDGRAALDRLRDRVLGPRGGTLVVVPQGLEGTRHLPGRIIVIGAPALRKADGAEALAADILAERLRSEARDPLIPALEWAGFRATFRLLTTGALPADALHGYGEAVLKAPQAPVDPAELADRRAAAAAEAQAAAPISDNEWVALQDICAE